MIGKIHCLLAALFLSLALFLTTSVCAQNKVVVIPLMEDAPPLEPYAPIADTHPPSSSYSLGTNYIIDKVTGLVWQQNTDDSQRNWNDAWDYCQDLELGGKTDWRLPSIDELMSIVHYGNYDPAINTVVFPDTDTSKYWSATAPAYSSERALVVDFRYGRLWFESKAVGVTRYVRCVRGLRERDSNFKDNGNGTVTDLATGLTWQRQDDNDTKDWNEADEYCDALDLAGGGWRLPTIKELQSIVDYRVSAPAIDTDAFPKTGPAASYWSVTTWADPLDEGAWCIYFASGDNFPGDKVYPNYARCVR